MGLTTGNTFSLTLQNPQDIPQSVSLFNQGSASSSDYYNQAGKRAVFPKSQWQNWYDADAGVTTAVIRVTITNSFIPVLQTGTLADPLTLQDVQEKVNSSWFTPQPTVSIKIFVDADDNFNVQVFGYPFSNVGKICTIRVNGTTDYPQIIATESFKTCEVSPLNNVYIITENTLYTTLLSTQTGSPMRVVALDLDSENQQQFARPIVHKQKDADGNVKQTTTLSVVDPYQFQTAHLVNVPVKGLVFDGNCEFDYTIDPFTTVKVTFRYVNLAESMLFGTAIEQQIADQYRVARKDMDNLSSGLTKVLVP